MEIKPKKCKGVNKCKDLGCGEMTRFRKYGLCHTCYKEWLLSPAGEETLNKSIVSGKKKSTVKEKKDFNKRKLESKSIAKLIQETRTPFQKLIRIRDHGKRCICCDKPLPFNIGDVDAGHFLSAEQYTGLIFHPENIHSQLKHCNQYLHGNESGYNSGLISRIGLIRYNKLISLKLGLKSHKWDRYKLFEMKEYYNKELRLVEKGEKNISEVDLSIGILKE